MNELRHKVYLIINEGFHGSFASKLFDILIILLIFLNFALIVIIEEFMHIPKTTFSWVYFFEWVLILIFCVEYIARVWCCVEENSDGNPGKTPFQKRLRYIVSVPAIIDFLSFFPFVVLYVISLFHMDLVLNIDVRIIKTLQIIRVLKLTRVFGYLRLIVEVLAINMTSFFGAIIVILNLFLIASMGIYFFERDIQPDTFGSIPKALWWSMITMTTIGYGDAVPITTGGKVFTFVFVLIGLGIVGIPISIVTASLQELVTKKRKMRKFIHFHYLHGKTENIHAKVLDYANTIEVKPKFAMETLEYEKQNNKRIVNPSKNTPKIVKTDAVMQCPHCFEEILIKGINKSYK